MRKVFASDPLYIPLLFPEYQRYSGKVDDNLLFGKKVYIIEGPERVVKTAEMLEKLEADVLYIIQHPSFSDICLDVPEDIVKYLIANRQYKKSPRTIARFNKLLEEEKLEFLKLSIAYKAWYTPYLKSRTKVYELFETFHLSTNPLMKQWYNLVGEYTVPRLYASLLTFLLKLSSYEDIEASLPKWYRDVVRKSHIQNLNVEGALELMKLENIPYPVLVPAFLLRSRKKVS